MNAAEFAHQPFILPQHRITPGKVYRMKLPSGRELLVKARMFCGELCYEIGNRIEPVRCEFEGTTFTEA